MKLDDYEFNGYKMYKTSEFFSEYNKETKLIEEFYIIQFKDGMPVKSWKEFEEGEWQETAGIASVMMQTFIKNLDESELFGILL